MYVGIGDVREGGEHEVKRKGRLDCSLMKSGKNEISRMYQILDARATYFSHSRV